MAEGGITLDEEMGSNSVGGISTAQCCFCEGPLPSLKSKLVCKSCYPDESNSYLCHHCVVMHVRKSHSVTDQNGQDVEVCGEHKSVCMFMCKTCQLKWFCADCFKDHAKHEYKEISESNEDMKKILGRIHNVLSDSDFTYKRISKCLDKAKQNELLMKDIPSLYSQSDIKEGLENVCARVIESVVPNVEQVISLNQKALSNMSVPVEEVDKALQHVGNVQVQLREMLASSLTQIARVHSSGGLDRIEKDQSQPLRVKMLRIEPNDVTEFKQSLEKEWKDLEDKIAALCSDFVRKVQFNKVKEHVVDLHDLRGEFKLLELPMSCERIDIAAPSGLLLLTCINNGPGFTVFQYSDLKQKPEVVMKSDKRVFSQIVGFVGWTAVVYCVDTDKYFSFLHCKPGKLPSNYSVVPLPDVFHEQAVWEHINSLIHPHQLLKYPANDPVCVLLADNIPIQKKPYSFGYCPTYYVGNNIYIFILNRFTYIYLISIQNTAEIQWEAQREVPCVNVSEHLGRFGCSFLTTGLFGSRYPSFISNWCLDCKVLKVYKVKEDDVNGARSRSENKLKVTCELTLEVPVLDLEKIAFLKERCIVLTKKQQVLSCENVLANKT